MASFGFSLGDVLIISEYAYSIYKSCKRAGEDFRAASEDVSSLESYLRTLEDEFRKPRSLMRRADLAKTQEFENLLNDCDDTLTDLGNLLARYKSLKKKHPRARDRLAFTASKQKDIRGKIATHSERLQRFLNGLHTGALGRIETQTERHTISFEEILAKLDTLHQEMVAGKRDKTIITNMNDWITQELDDDDITVADVRVNRSAITAWLENTPAADDFKSAVESIAGQDEDSEDFEGLEMPALAIQSKQRGKQDAHDSAVEDVELSCHIHRTQAAQGLVPAPRTSQLLPDHNESRELESHLDLRNKTKTDIAEAFEVTPAADHLKRATDPISEQAKADLDEKSNKLINVGSSRESTSSTASEDVDFEVDITPFAYRRTSATNNTIFEPPHSDQYQESQLGVPPLKQLPCHWVTRWGLERDLTSAIAVPLPVSLEDIMNEVEKTIRIIRVDSGVHAKNQIIREREKKIRITRDLRQSSQLTFDCLGNHRGWVQQKLIFNIMEMPHALFSRPSGEQTEELSHAGWIEHKMRISLSEAFDGWERTLKTLGGATLKVSCSGPTDPTYRCSVSKFGLPRSYAWHERGALILSLDIVHPESLTSRQRAELEDILSQSKPEQGRFKVTLLEAGSCDTGPLEFRDDSFYSFYSKSTGYFDPISQ